MSSATPGRPAVGPKVPINFPAGLLRDIETGASIARLTRAAWVRRAAARALPEIFEGVLAPDDLVRYFTARMKDAEPEHEVDDTTIRCLLAAADDGILTIEPFTTKAEAIEATGWRRQLSFVTRTFLAGGTKITIYQVSFGRITYQRPDDSDSSQHSGYTLYLDQEAARAHHKFLHTTFLHV
ncbi:hypothetical protein [Streptomyces angustmyceticus]|uniref:hypothetical protein n=1 Tax=Streptomyces angustmyceticus TaxID=285578 RepID=UPI00381E3A27